MAAAAERTPSASRPATARAAAAPTNPGDPRVCPFQHLHAAGDTTFDSCVKVFTADKEYRDRVWQAVRLAANHGMVIGRDYKLTYQEDWPGHWPPKHVGGSWIGEFTGETDTEYILNTGPQGGGSIRKEWVYQILEVPVGHPMYTPRIRGPGR
jgi:hypothetical protein